MEALVDKRVLGTVEQVFDAYGRAGVGEPAAHVVSFRFPGTGLRHLGTRGRWDERADHPEDRKEDPEEEHDPMTLPQRHQAERERDQQIEENPEADSPPHVSLLSSAVVSD